MLTLRGLRGCRCGCDHRLRRAAARRLHRCRTLGGNLARARSASSAQCNFLGQRKIGASL
jgi:hypothetical protein